MLPKVVPCDILVLSWPYSLQEAFVKLKQRLSIFHTRLSVASKKDVNQESRKRKSRKSTRTIWTAKQKKRKAVDVKTLMGGQVEMKLPEGCKLDTKFMLRGKATIPWLDLD